MTSRPFTPDKLRDLLARTIRLKLAQTAGKIEGGYHQVGPNAPELLADAMIAILTPLLDATHEAACRAMREEAAKVAIEVAKHPFGYSGSSAAYRIAADIHALHLPKREG